MPFSSTQEPKMKIVKGPFSCGQGYFLVAGGVPQNGE
jgi:hypothetical protein